MPMPIPFSIVESIKPWPTTEKTSIWWWSYLDLLTKICGRWWIVLYIFQVTMYSFVLSTLQVKIYTRWWIVLCACSVHAHGSVHATTSLPDTVTRIGRWNVAQLRLCSCVHCSEVVVQLISSKGLHNRSKRKSYKQIMDSCKSLCTFKWIFIYDSTVDFS